MTADLDALAVRLRAHAQWLHEQFPGWVMQSDQRGTMETDILSAADALDAAAVDVARMDKAEALLAAGGSIDSTSDNPRAVFLFGPIGEAMPPEPEHSTLRDALDAYQEAPDA
jgi:hypothetical protein